MIFIECKIYFKNKTKIEKILDLKEKYMLSIEPDNFFQNGNNIDRIFTSNNKKYFEIHLKSKKINTIIETIDDILMNLVILEIFSNKLLLNN